MKHVGGKIYKYNKLIERSGPWFNIKMSSYQYRKSHCGDKTVVRSFYLHNGISYIGKMASLYWFRPQLFREKQWDIGGKRGRHSVPKCHTLTISINPATTISITLIRRSKHEAEWQWQWILNFPKFIPWIKYPEECQRTCTSTRNSLTKQILVLKI